jgi:DNA-binding response OmpR family regulator
MLLKLRRLLLEKAGFSVIDASSVEQAFGVIAEGGFDLLVMSSGRPGNSCFNR